MKNKMYDKIHELWQDIEELGMMGPFTDDFDELFCKAHGAIQEMVNSEEYIKEI